MGRPPISSSGCSSTLKYTGILFMLVNRYGSCFQRSWRRVGIRRPAFSRMIGGERVLFDGKDPSWIGLGVTFTARSASSSGIQEIPSSKKNIKYSDLSPTVDSEREDEEEVLFNMDDFKDLPKGTPEGFYVVKQYETSNPFQLTDEAGNPSVNIRHSDLDRLGLNGQNVSLPIALMLLDPEEYPSLSRARKACRKGNVLIHKGPLSLDDESGKSVFDATRCKKGRVGDRVMVGDVVAKQVRMGSGYFPVLNYQKPSFDVPVIFQDDHFALVNKPSGIVVYNQRNGGHGTMTVRAALPFVLDPPKAGTFHVMRRPASVHRLDKPTSGLLCVAKTKPAMVELCRQFHDRDVKKTYTAIVNGLPTCDRTITSQEAFELGVDVDPTADAAWHYVDSPLEEKHAVTVWRPLRYAKSMHAHDNYLTLVELKPKTGRYHQLRRHMAWECDRPLLGDDEYDEGTPEAMKFRHRGLFLASTKVTLEHPYYNSKIGRKVWDNLEDNKKTWKGGRMWLCNESNKVLLSTTIDLPDKFEKLLEREDFRFHKFAT